MSSTRSRLTLDEQSFEGLLAAAFTIQEHNDRRRGTNEPLPVPTAPADPAPLCDQCGTTLPSGEETCPTCGPDKLRPGERLQRTWASMWMMSQEQGMWPEPPEKDGTTPAASSAPPVAERSSTARNLAPSVPASFSPAPESNPAPTLRIQEAYDPHAIDDAVDGGIENAAPGNLFPGQAAFAQHSSRHDVSSRGPALRDATFIDPAFDFSEEEQDWSTATSQEQGGDELIPSSALSTDSTPASAALTHNFWDLRVKLRFHRADLYLGMAIFVAAVALLWPSAATPQKPKLPTWERMLIAMGIAEAPQPVAHFRGDPNIKVWVDTHTALYYCPGEELYGKSLDGHYSTQREAQSDSFEPAERSVCVE